MNSKSNSPDPQWPRWKHRLHEIIFEADTKLGKLFDVVLLIAIITSVILICIESTLPTEELSASRKSKLIDSMLSTTFQSLDDKTESIQTILEAAVLTEDEKTLLIEYVLSPEDLTDGQRQSLVDAKSSSESLSPNDKTLLYWLEVFEWIFTILFTLEYILRIICVRKPLRYIFSFYGIVDFLAFMPNYIGLVTNTNSSLSVVRALRLVRVLRVLKLVWLMSEAEELGRSIWQARGKVVVFLGVIVIAVVVAGTAMYEIEGPKNGFDSIPQSMYWATVTMTTVGYGDVVPITFAGKTAATLLILLGYSLIIVPTGFVSAEYIVQKTRLTSVTTQGCPECLREGHEMDAKFCKFCGAKLNLD